MMAEHNERYDPPGDMLNFGPNPNRIQSFLERSKYFGRAIWHFVAKPPSLDDPTLRDIILRDRIDEGWQEIRDGAVYPIESDYAEEDSRTIVSNASNSGVASELHELEQGGDSQDELPDETGSDGGVSQEPRESRGGDDEVVKYLDEYIGGVPRIKFNWYGPRRWQYGDPLPVSGEGTGESDTPQDPLYPDSLLDRDIAEQEEQRDNRKGGTVEEPSVLETAPTAEHRIFNEGDTLYLLRYQKNPDRSKDTVTIAKAKFIDYYGEEPENQEAILRVWPDGLSEPDEHAEKLLTNVSKLLTHDEVYEAVKDMDKFAGIKEELVMPSFDQEITNNPDNESLVSALGTTIAIRSFQD